MFVCFNVSINALSFKAAYSETMNIFSKIFIFFLNHL